MSVVARSSRGPIEITTDEETAMDLLRLTDVASRALGTTVMYANDDFFADAHNHIRPDPPQHDVTTFGPRGKMSDGWETARRRDDGDDWLTVRLATPAVRHEIVIDTSRFVGNAPGWAVVSDPVSDPVSGAVLLPRKSPLPDLEHRLSVVPGAPEVSSVRLDIYPDGGISRFRVIGSVLDEARGQMS
jgi:allantoicase